MKLKKLLALVLSVAMLALCLSGCGGCPNYPLCHPCLASACCETGDGNGRPEYKCKMLLAEAAACKDMLKKIQG